MSEWNSGGYQNSFFHIYRILEFTNKLILYKEGELQILLSVTAGFDSRDLPNK